MLTIISALFMPISFLSGFFGMNFSALPFNSPGMLAGALGAIIVATADARSVSSGVVGSRCRPCYNKGLERGGTDQQLCCPIHPLGRMDKQAFQRLLIAAELYATVELIDDPGFCQAGWHNPQYQFALRCDAVALLCRSYEGLLERLSELLYRFGRPWLAQG